MPVAGHAAGVGTDRLGGAGSSCSSRMSPTSSSSRSSSVTSPTSCAGRRRARSRGAGCSRSMRKSSSLHGVPSTGASATGRSAGVVARRVSLSTSNAWIIPMTLSSVSSIDRHAAVARLRDLQRRARDRESRSSMAKISARGVITSRTILFAELHDAADDRHLLALADALELALAQEILDGRRGRRAPALGALARERSRDTRRATTTNGASDDRGRPQHRRAGAAARRAASGARSRAAGADR